MVQQTLSAARPVAAEGEFEPIHRRRLPSPPPGPDPRDPVTRRAPPVPPWADDDGPSPLEQDLLERLRRGDELAFARLYEQHWDGVYRVSARILSDPDAARDVAQEAFIQLFRRPPEPSSAPLRAWLYRVAIHRAYNDLRSSRRRRIREDAAFDASATLIAGAPDQEVAEAANRAEERELVRRALRDLGERPREVLLLRLEGLSYAAIAAAIGVAPGSVGTLLARAERAFKAAYQAQRGGM